MKTGAFTVAWDEESCRQGVVKVQTRSQGEGVGKESIVEAQKLEAQ